MSCNYNLYSVLDILARDHETFPPMPLKHATETFLLFLLAVITATTGLVLALMPHLPAGLLLWAVLLFLTVLYPIVLSPLFIKRRADIPFRVLHWFPAFMVVLSIIFQMIALYFPDAEFLNRIFTWSWSLGAVLVGFISLIVFSVSVLRRKTQRVAIFLSILSPFVLLALLSQTMFDWNRPLQATLLQGDWWRVFDMAGTSSSGGLIADTGSGDSNLEPSEDSAEERWRERLRAIEERRERIAARLKENKDNKPVAVTSSSSSKVAMGQTSSKPAHLPHSGFEWQTIIAVMVAAYCGVLHQRAKKRA